MLASKRVRAPAKKIGLGFLLSMHTYLFLSRNYPLVGFFSPSDTRLPPQVLESVGMQRWWRPRKMLSGFFPRLSGELVMSTLMFSLSFDLGQASAMTARRLERGYRLEMARDRFERLVLYMRDCGKHNDWLCGSRGFACDVMNMMVAFVGS